MSDNFINITVNVNGKAYQIKMEKGCVFKNNGGSYCIFDDGSLKFQKTGNADWEDTEVINMKNYQWKVFQNLADNNDEEKGIIVFSKKDIQKATKLSEQKLLEDMKKDLPNGYRIEIQEGNSSKRSNPDITVYATNGNPNTSANLNFRINKNDNQKQKIMPKPETSALQNPSNTQNSSISRENDWTLNSILKLFPVFKKFNVRDNYVMIDDNLNNADITPHQRDAAARAGVTPAFILEIEEREGKCSKLYNDSVGIPTIGIGHNTRFHNDTHKYTNRVITEDEIYDLLVKDIEEARDTLQNELGHEIFDNFSNKQKEALYDLIFNIGTLQKSPKLKEALQNNNYAEALCQMDQISANGKVLSGLCKRRLMDYGKFLEGSYRIEDLKTKNEKGETVQTEECKQMMKFIQKIYDFGYKKSSKINRLSYNSVFESYLGTYIDEGWLKVKN